MRKKEKNRIGKKINIKATALPYFVSSPSFLVSSNPNKNNSNQRPNNEQRYKEKEKKKKKKVEKKVVSCEDGA